MKSLATIVFAVLLLAACQQNATIRTQAGSGFQRLDGATLVLNQDIRVPAGKARVYVQDGGAGTGGGRIFSGGFDSYRPHCAFEIRSVNHNGVVIRAGSFAITGVQRSTVQVVSSGPVRVVALNLASGSGMDGGGGSASYYDGYHFWLASEDQPEVRRMSCYGVFAQPYELYPPTLAEIDQALGGVARIRY